MTMQLGSLLVCCVCCMWVILLYRVSQSVLLLSVEASLHVCVCSVCHLNIECIVLKPPGMCMCPVFCVCLVCCVLCLCTDFFENMLISFPYPTLPYLKMTTYLLTMYYQQLVFFEPMLYSDAAFNKNFFNINK